MVVLVTGKSGLPAAWKMGNMCRPPPGPAGEDASREAEVADEDQPANCLVGASQKLTCFEKTDSFDGGSEVSTPGPKSYSGYVPVTPVSSLSYDNNAEDGPHPRFFPESRDENFIGENVLLHLYDLNDTLGHMNSVSVDILGIGGALHVGVEVLGNEWSFGMQGVSVTQPMNNQYYSFRQTVAMGRTLLKRKEVESVILSLKRKWSGKDYDILERNCGHFCNELCEKLGVGRMPAWVTRVAETMAHLPGSRTLKDSLKNVILEDADLGEDDPAYIADEDGGEGYIANTPTGLGRDPTLPTGSPVRCRQGGSDEGLGVGVLPRARCEAFRVHEGRSQKAIGSRAQMCSDGSYLTDKYGDQPRPRQLQFAPRGGA